MSKSAVKSIALHSHPRLMERVVQFYSALRGIRVTFNNSKIRIAKRSKQIIISRESLPYSRDIISNFDFYFNATTGPIKDFSEATHQDITGFHDFALHTPGLPEPIATIRQYSDFLALAEGQTIIDLGAYSGLSSIFFNQLVGASGTVISVEADPVNANSCVMNFKKAQEVFGFCPQLVTKAIWNEETFLEFASEGNLGSAVKSLLPRSDAPGIRVPTVTLSGLVTQFNLTQVDAIKADVEGSEYWAFSDAHFFSEFHPKIIFEAFKGSSEFTKGRKTMDLLKTYGYTCTEVKQVGSPIPLIFCQ